jgi:hypothetical protein
MSQPLPASIWEEFCALVKLGEFPDAKLQPYSQSLIEPLTQTLSGMASRGFFDRWGSPVEVHLVQDQVHFLCLEGSEGSQETFCFSFIIAEDNWFFQHLENITIRLDKIGELPASSFPDLPEKQKAWVRQEFQVTEMVRLYKHLCEEKGQEFALAWFKDGVGYALAARTWVPFVPPPKAFILYLCWEQANLRGNRVTLLNLDDQFAQVVLESIYFELYERTHLRQQIGFGDYRQLFETIWQDRANQAGWQVSFLYDGQFCRLEFAQLK